MKPLENLLDKFSVNLKNALTKSGKMQVTFTSKQKKRSNDFFKLINKVFTSKDNPFKK